VTISSNSVLISASVATQRV